MILPRERILVVEDEVEIRELILLQLQRDGYIVDGVGTGEDAVHSLNTQQYNLVLLDWMLPGMSGLEITRMIRTRSKTPDVPVLMVTARADSGDIISGLEAGADDYVTKPFDTAVLMARVRSLLRRSKTLAQPKAGPVKSLQVGGLSLDPEAHKVSCRGEELHLTPSEFKLLHTLLMSAGKVFTREALIKEVQGDNVSVVDRAIDTHVFGLRKKLGLCSDVLETVRGIGYRVKALDLISE